MRNFYRSDLLDCFAIRSILLVVLVVMLTSCGVFKRSNRINNLQGLRLSEIREVAPEREVVERKLSRKALQRALARGEDVNSLRMVEVFSQRELSVSAQYPMYRLFGIHSGSVFELLGLQNSDVLVTVNDYLLFERELFWESLKLLPNENSYELELIRGKKTFLFHYLLR